MALTQRKAKPTERTLMLCDEIGNLRRIDSFLSVGDVAQILVTYLVDVLAERGAAPNLRSAGEYARGQCGRDPGIRGEKSAHGAGFRESCGQCGG